MFYNFRLFRHPATVLKFLALSYGAACVGLTFLVEFLGPGVLQVLKGKSFPPFLIKQTISRPIGLLDHIWRGGRPAPRPVHPGHGHHQGQPEGGARRDHTIAGISVLVTILYDIL